MIFIPGLTHLVQEAGLRHIPHSSIATLSDCQGLLLQGHCRQLRPVCARCRGELQRLQSCKGTCKVLSYEHARFHELSNAQHAH